MFLIKIKLEKVLFPTIRIERWKYNEEYGLFISNFGHIKDEKGKLKHISVSRDSYCVFHDTKNNRLVPLHRAVMETWDPKHRNESVDHLDHNKRNNAVYNLEWVTKDENIRRARRDLVEQKIDTGPFKIKIDGKVMQQGEALKLFPKENRAQAERKMTNTIRDGQLRRYYGKKIETV